MSSYLRRERSLAGPWKRREVKVGSQRVISCSHWMQSAIRSIHLYEKTGAATHGHPRAEHTERADEEMRPLETVVLGEVGDQR